jgi:putative transcriptional regulator
VLQYLDDLRPDPCSLPRLHGPWIASWRFLLLLSLLALLPLSARLDAALPKQGLTTSQETSLAGQLLVASPRMGDPRFERTVILLVKHDKKGALGITINRPLGVRPLAMVLENLGDTVLPGAATVRIFAGGPVQTEIGFVIHSADYDRQETLRITTDLAVTASPDVLRDMARGQGPKKVLVAFGYAGWSAGQLETELARDDWLVAAADPALVFDTPRERVWDAAMAQRAQ